MAEAWQDNGGKCGSWTIISRGTVGYEYMTAQGDQGGTDRNVFTDRSQGSMMKGDIRSDERLLLMARLYGGRSIRAWSICWITIALTISSYTSVAYRFALITLDATKSKKNGISIEQYNA